MYMYITWILYNIVEKYTRWFKYNFFITVKVPKIIIIRSLTKITCLAYLTLAYGIFRREPYSVRSGNSV